MNENHLTNFIKNIIAIQKNLFSFLNHNEPEESDEFLEVISPFLTSKTLFIFLLHNLNTVVQFPKLNVAKYIRVIEFVSHYIKANIFKNEVGDKSKLIVNLQPEEIFPSIFNRRFAVMCLIKYGVLDLNFVLSQVTQTMSEYFLKSEELISDNQDLIASSIRSDNLDSFKELISHQNDFNQKINHSLFERCQFVNDSTLLEYATFFNSIKIIEYLLSNGAKETDKSNLIKSLYLNENGNISKMNQQELEFLIEYHCLHQNLNELNFENKSLNLYKLLLKASKENNIIFLYNFLPFLSEISKESIKPSLNAICEAGREDLIEIFNSDNDLSQNLDWNGKKIKTNISLFESAIKNDHLNVVQSLLKVKGIDIRGIYHHEETPLHYAAKYNMTVIGHFLLSTKKISVNCKDSVYFFYI